jgi:hypothetical protein
MRIYLMWGNRRRDRLYGRVEAAEDKEGGGAGEKGRRFHGFSEREIFPICHENGFFFFLEASALLWFSVQVSSPVDFGGQTHRSGYIYMQSKCILQELLHCALSLVLVATITRRTTPGNCICIIQCRPVLSTLADQQRLRHFQRKSSLLKLYTSEISKAGLDNLPLSQAGKHCLPSIPSRSVGALFHLTGI